jgi:ferric-dicitrate binding protein FerR (iron transport regulator)
MSDPDNERETTIQDVVARLFDGDLSEDGFRHLEQRLRDDPAARARYFDCVWLENSLADTLNLASGLRERRMLAFKGGGPKWSLGIAAAAVVLLSLMVLKRDPQTVPAQTSLRLSANSEWTIDGAMNPERTTIAHGSELRLLQGVVELRLPLGVAAVVEAPARMVVVDDRTLRLDGGRSYFNVGPDGGGFTVVTPHQRIVDLGTEFGVDCQPDRPEVGLHVFKGRVRVDGLSSGDQGEIIKDGRSVELDGPQVAGDLTNAAKSFLRTLPSRVDVIFQDDFENGISDGVVDGYNKGLDKWRGSGAAVYNPSDDGRWYDRAELNDQSPSEGVIGGMKGPNLGFFYLPTRGSMIRSELGEISADSRYTVSLAIGVRSESPQQGEVFDGYTIRLKSGDSTLAQLSSNAPPGPYNSISLVGFSWDSSEMPPVVKPGDPLALEIAPNQASGTKPGYLDFDNVRVSVVGHP